MDSGGRSSLILKAEGRRFDPTPKHPIGVAVTCGKPLSNLRAVITG
jgi:hypothetical protein